MKKLHATIGLLLGGLLVLSLSAKDTTMTADTAMTHEPTVVVGTFDSRAVAVAYVRSDEFTHSLRALRADVERARAAGDEKLAAELEARGPAMQKRIHEQGFGAAPIDEIIAKIEHRLPGIAALMRVDVIVSKWNLAWQSPTARFVDVTDLLAAEFHPDEATLKVIRDLVKTEPVPLDQLSEDH